MSIFEISLIEKRVEILKTADIVTAVQGARELFERNSKFVLILKHLHFLCACIYLIVFFIFEKKILENSQRWYFIESYWTFSLIQWLFFVHLLTNLDFRGFDPKIWGKCSKWQNLCTYCTYFWKFHTFLEVETFARTKSQ